MSVLGRSVGSPLELSVKVSVPHCGVLWWLDSQSHQDSSRFQESSLSEYSYDELLLIISGSLSIAARMTSSEEVAMCASVALPVWGSNLRTIREAGRP